MSLPSSLEAGVCDSQMLVLSQLPGQGSGAALHQGSGVATSTPGG